jgi:hypothetical protein
MALTQQTTTDLVGKTQTITFNNPSQVDQITYSNNQITFQAISTFNLTKSDLLLYIQYLQTFNTLLIANFPIVNSSIGQAWPLSQFDITESSSGVTHIIYTQTSTGNTVMGINYVPQATSGAFTARASPVTITLQEYFMTVLMLGQYYNQVFLN